MPQRPEDTNNNKIFLPLSDNVEKVGKLIIDAAFTVHKNLGPGLLEKVYEVCFCHELVKRDFVAKKLSKIIIK